MVLSTISFLIEISTLRQDMDFALIIVSRRDIEGRDKRRVSVEIIVCVTIVICFV